MFIRTLDTRAPSGPSYCYQLVGQAPKARRSRETLLDSRSGSRVDLGRDSMVVRTYMSFELWVLCTNMDGQED